MAVTVLSRPAGHKILDTPITAVVSASGDDALFTKAAHSLSDGNYIYVTSNLGNYNGFWPVDVISSSTFKILDFAGNPVTYVNGGSVTYYQTLPHSWHSIYLPIVYVLEATNWPINSIETARTVSSFTDDAGYVNLNLSGAIKGSLVDLEYVKISGADDPVLNRIYQIINSVGTSDITIDLNYDAAYDFTGATVQYYYNNYHVKVQIYGGLETGHDYDEFKPYELISTLSLIPDENNLIRFSVNEIIQSKIAIKNDLTNATLPINLDAFTEFYIKYAESYDESDGSEVTTYTSTFVDDSDNYQGFAIAGVLPFKNIYSGSYSQYVYTEGFPASWLVTQERLIGIPGYYLDVSFINNNGSSYIVETEKYNSGQLITTTQTTKPSRDEGVYRVEIEIDANYDMYIVRILMVGITPEFDLPITEDLCIDIIDACTLSDGISSEGICIRMTEDDCFRILEDCPDDPIVENITFSFSSIAYLFNIENFKEGSFQLINDIAFSGTYDVTLELHTDNSLLTPGDSRIVISKNGVEQHVQDPPTPNYVTDTFTLTGLVDSDVILIYFKVNVLPGDPDVEPGSNVWVSIDSLASTTITPVEGSPSMYTFHAEN